MYRYPEAPEGIFRVVLDEDEQLSRFSSLLFTAGTFAIEQQKPVQLIVCTMTMMTDGRLWATPRFAYSVEAGREKLCIDLQPTSVFGPDNHHTSGRSFWVDPKSAIRSIEEIDVTHLA